MGICINKYCPKIDTVISISDTWEQMKEDIHSRLQGKELVIAGDGRNDSPGHSAQYCTYTIMTHDTKDIVDIVIVDKRLCGRKSSLMEKYGLKKSLEKLKGHLNIKELVTDAHTQIRSMMKKEFEDITHSWDIWHGAKNLGKKISAAASVKQNEDLAPWVKHITNHFWHCCEQANGSVETFRVKWLGLLHHVVDEHEWMLGECDHRELDQDRQKPWLKKGSPAHNTLRDLIMNKYFMNTFVHYVNFRHTGSLEIFNNLILMYAAKRFSFKYPSYVARNQLAAIDYQHHKDRSVIKDKDGNARLKRLYSKRSGRYSTVEVKVKKDYSYHLDLQNKAINACINDPEPLRRKVELAENDPRRISAHLAPVVPGETKEIAAQQKSRYT